MSEPEPRQSRWIEIATALALVPILIGAALFYPPAREALGDARRAISQVLGAADWTGYYLELDPTALPGELSSPQLVFAEGAFPGRGVRIVDPPAFAGRWSPSGERFAFTSGRRLMIADKRGEVRSLGELLDLTPAGSPVWVNENELVLTMGRSQPPGRWFVRIDADGALLDQRALSSGSTIESASPDGRYALARSSTGLELVDLSDGTSARSPAGAEYVGWLRDGRVLLRAVRSGRYRLEARIVGAGLGERIADLSEPFEVNVRGQWIAILERERGNESNASLWLVRPGSPAQRVLTDLPVVEAWPSTDGRYIAVWTAGEDEDDPTPRAGVLEVATGRIAYACEIGCAQLRLR